MEGEGGIKMMRKAEIDTSAPFRSVKEAVLLFGERVLASEVYVNKIQQMQEQSLGSDDQQVKAELEETKESLVKAREESMVMASCLSSLQDELERTRRELQNLKEQEKSSPSSSSSHIINKQQVRIINPLSAEIEHLKFMEDSTQFDHHVLMMDKNEVVKNKVECQKKRYVSFGNHSTPSFSRVLVPPKPNDGDNAVLQRHPSLRKQKKKSLIPFLGGIFSRKKSNSFEVA